MKVVLFIVVALFAMWLLWPVSSVFSEDSSNSPTPQQILDELMASNENFSNCKSCVSKATYPNYEKVEFVHPDIIVFSCSEALPDPHWIFDKPFGRIASVRNMGNIISIAGMTPNSVELGSIEYAVSEQGVKVVIVLGHKRCSIAQSAINDPSSRGNIPAIYQVLSVAVTAAKRTAGNDSDLILQTSIENNVRNAVLRISHDNYGLSDLIKEGKLLVVGAMYDPDTKRVELLK